MAWRGTGEKRLSAMQIFGTAVMAVGLLIIVISGIRSVKKPYSDFKESHTSYIEFDEDYESELSEKKVAIEGRDNRISILFCGALLIFAGVPFFYMPYTDGGLILRMKNKKKDSQDENEEEIASDPEFDYPDNDFDFIIRREIYELNHREQLENIRKKHSKR